MARAADGREAEEREAARLALQEAFEKKNTTDAGITQAVVDARAVTVVVNDRTAKVTWREIAEALGMHQPNATRKYKPFVDKMPPVNRWDGEADPRGAALAAVRRAVEAHEQAKKAELVAVARARSHDVTWREIADAVGMAEPNAFTKYSPRLEERRTVTVREDDAKTPDASAT